MRELLFELGLLRTVLGRTVPDERHLCHRPQERVFFDGRWQDGLLPHEGVPAGTLAQYRRFAAEVQAAIRLGFALPTHRAGWRPAHAALDAQTLVHWLQARGLDDPWLGAYLDHCCRDDYGGGIEGVSAWAGLHYFASRHGFQPPGEAESGRCPRLHLAPGQCLADRAPGRTAGHAPAPPGPGDAHRARAPRGGAAGLGRADPVALNAGLRGR